MATASKKRTPNFKVCGHTLKELRVLGSGGQGSVSLCKDTASGKLFALKYSAAVHDVSHEYDILRFLMTSGVRKGIVQVHGMDIVESGPLSGQTCVLMDFCHGGDLLSELKRHPGFRLEDRQAAALVSQAAAAAVGRKKRRHDNNCDPWPHDLHFVLADFGLACEFQQGHLIRDGSLVGTKEYIAPEMMKGTYDERADVWSLGMVLHLLLTGDFPAHIQKVRHQLRLNGCFDIEAFLFCTMRMCPDELDLAAPMYSQLSEKARSLLAGMLRKKPHDRLTLTEVRAHPWLQAMDAEPQHSESSQDLKRVCNSTLVDSAIARIPHFSPIIVPEEVEFIQVNPLAALAAY